MNIVIYVFNTPEYLLQRLSPLFSLMFLKLSKPWFLLPKVTWFYQQAGLLFILQCIKLLY